MQVCVEMSYFIVMHYDESNLGVKYGQDVFLKFELHFRDHIIKMLVLYDATKM